MKALTQIESIDAGARINLAPPGEPTWDCRRPLATNGSRRGIFKISKVLSSTALMVKTLLGRSGREDCAIIFCTHCCGSSQDASCILLAL